MKKIVTIFTCILLTVKLFGAVEEDILEATNSFKRFVETNKIPKQVIQNAKAIVIIPNYMKAGFLIGGQYGKGIVVIQKANQEWTNPFFISLTGGSLGLQIGFEANDTMLVFMTQKSLKELLDSKITIGTELSASVGPIKENYNKYKEINFQSDILTYYIKEGLFLGASFDGAVINHDNERNSYLYGTSNVSSIIDIPKKKDIYGIRELDKYLDRYTK